MSNKLRLQVLVFVYFEFCPKLNCSSAESAEFCKWWLNPIDNYENCDDDSHCQQMRTAKTWLHPQKMNINQQTADENTKFGLWSAALAQIHRMRNKFINRQSLFYIINYYFIFIQTKSKRGKSYRRRIYKNVLPIYPKSYFGILRTKQIFWN